MSEFGRRSTIGNRVGGKPSQGFESPSLRHLQLNNDGGVAQLARALGSYPRGRGFESLRRYQYNHGEVPKRPNGADCKSVA